MGSTWPVVSFLDWCGQWQAVDPPKKPVTEWATVTVGKVTEDGPTKIEFRGTEESKLIRSTVGVAKWIVNYIQKNFNVDIRAGGVGVLLASEDKYDSVIGGYLQSQGVAIRYPEDNEANAKPMIATST